MHSSERFKTRATHIQSCPPPTSPQFRRLSAMRSVKESKKRDSSDDVAAKHTDSALPLQAIICHQYPTLPRIVSISLTLLLFMLAGISPPVSGKNLMPCAGTIIDTSGPPRDDIDPNGNLSRLLVRHHPDNTTTYCHYDGNGNVTGLSDASGAQTAEYLYSAFGELLERSGSYADKNPYRFSTKPFEDVGGLYYYGYRYLQAAHGGWLSQDPLGETGGLNLHGFVGGDPINSFDSLGLLTEKQAMAADALWGGVLFGAAGGLVEGDLLTDMSAAQYLAACGEKQMAEDQFRDPSRYLKDATKGAVVGVVTGGVLKGGGALIKGPLSGAFSRISPYLDKLKKVANRPLGSFFRKNAAKGVATPHGLALQADSAAARAALGEVQSGATVYRQGTFGVQNTADAQFWSLQNPAGAQGFANKMGMPGGSGSPDWIMGGTVSRGSPVITRPAPGIGTNVGGAMEAVVPKNGVSNLWFHMPD
ncbi:MAG: RHS repeat-associated core domain-containing protein [Luteolibacter sp.]|nr:RHS repeat-associated core domain-containing protein [Luteolibacter sp.]